MADDDLERGLALVGRHEWVRARELLTRTPATAGSVAGLSALALACWWLDDGPGFVRARERLFRLHQERHEPLEAGRVAVRLSWDAEIVGQEPVLARAWLDRAQALVLRGGGTGADRLLCELREVALSSDTDPAGALERARRARAEAIAEGSPDLEALALVCEGDACLGLGDAGGGIRALEHAALMVCSGDANDPLPVTLACCRLLQACADVRDYQRASIWLPRVVERSALNERGTMAVIGRCSTVPLLLGRGSWREADAAIEDGLLHFAAGNDGWERSLTASLAELRLRQGRVSEAEALLARAEPDRRCRLIRAEIALANGDPGRACEHARSFIRHPGRSGLYEQLSALELLARAEAARGDLDAARRAHGEFAAIAARAGTPALDAATQRCGGMIAIAGGDVSEAIAALEDAVDLYLEAGATYDAAAARDDLARALDAAGRDAEAERVRGLPATASDAGVPLGDCPLTERELDVLALVARGFSNRRIATELVVSPHTIHRHVANILARLGCSTRTAAVAVATREGWLHGRALRAGGRDAGRSTPL